MSVEDIISEETSDENDDMGEKYKSEEWLREQYIDRGKTQTDIARECDVSDGTISKWVNKFDIQKGYKSEIWLQEQYIEKDRSQEEIAAECNVSEQTIRYWRDKFGIYKGNNECPLCGYKSDTLGHHLHHSDHGYPDIDQYKWEILVGHIMGDASYGKGTVNGRLEWNMTNKKYMEWLNEELGWLCYKPSLVKTPEESAQLHFLRERGLPKPHQDKSYTWTGDPDNYKPMYRSRTICHPWMDRLDWLDDEGKKRFPETLKLTPTMVKIWYCDDGSLNWGGVGRPRARITASSQTDMLDLLADKFGDVVCDPVVSGGMLRFNTDETEKFLNWIGDPPSGMRYKFCLESREKYDELKP